MLEGVAGFTLGVCCVDEGRQFEMQPGLEGDLQLYRSRAVQVRPFCQSLGAGRHEFGWVRMYCR